MTNTHSMPAHFRDVIDWLFRQGPDTPKLPINTHQAHDVALTLGHFSASTRAELFAQSRDSMHSVTWHAADTVGRYISQVLLEHGGRLNIVPAAGFRTGVYLYPTSAGFGYGCKVSFATASIPGLAPPVRVVMRCLVKELDADAQERCNQLLHHAELGGTLDANEAYLTFSNPIPMTNSAADAA